MEITADLADNHAPCPVAWDREPVIVVVRHPATWLASWWAHCHRYPQDANLGDAGPFNEEKPYDWMVRATDPHTHQNFEAFARSSEFAYPGFVQGFFAPYLLNATHVLHQETLTEDLHRVCGELPYLEPFNVGDNAPVPSEEMVDFIERIDGDYGI